MKVVILCGGQGTRLREQTGVMPKPMVEIGGRPILWHIMKSYSHFGLKQFVLCLGYKGEIIRQYFDGGLHRDGSSNWAVSMVDTGEKAQTGARLFRVRDQIDGQSFCLTYGDGVGSIDIRALLEFHKKHGKIATVTGVRPPSRFGELLLDGDQVVSFNEKPQVTESFINGGFFVIEPEFIERYLANEDELTLEREPLQSVAADGELMMYPHTGFWQPMDTYREWKMLEEMWENGTAEWRMWD